MDILKQIYNYLAVSVNICVNIELFLVTKKLLTSHFLTAKSGCIAELKKKIQDEIHIHITFHDIFNAQCSFNSNVIRRSQ